MVYATGFGMRAVVCGVSFVLAGACGGMQDAPVSGTTEQATGSLSVGVSSSEVNHDVAVVQFKVVSFGSVCDGTALNEKTVPLAGSPMDDSSPFATGGEHAYAQAMFVLPAGKYTVCMLPLTEAGAPSKQCSAASSVALVTANQTTKLLLTSVCQGSPTGGLSATGVLNDPPQIVDVDIQLSANPCEYAVIALQAIDPNQDSPLPVRWSQDWPVPGASFIAGENPAVFWADTPGDYTVVAIVDDTHGAETTLSIPIHVSASALAADTCQMSPAADTYIRTDLDIRRNDNYGCNPLIEVGTGRGGGGQPYGAADAIRTLLLFNPHLIPTDASIISATLEMTISGYEEGTSNLPFTLDVLRNVNSGSPALPQWREGNGIENEAYGQKVYEAPMNCVWTDPAYGVAWSGANDGGDANNQGPPAFDSAVVASAIVDPVSQTKGSVVSWDITSLVRGWQDGSIPNFGITIRDLTTDGTFRGISFGSREQLFGFPAQYAAAAPRLLIRLSR
jgi:hypothetical protein